MKLQHRLFQSASVRRNRRGTVIILSSVILVIVLGIAAFTVDIGLINVTKGQAQNAADSAAHAAMQKLVEAFGPGALVSSQTASTNAGTTATAMVARFRTGDRNSTTLVASRDMRFGQRTWNSATNSWTQQWGVTPYNMVEVNVRRTTAAGAPLGAVFAAVFGRKTFDVQATGIAACAPVVGFELPTGSTDTIDVLPITLDLTTWNNLLAQVYSGASNGFTDQYKYNSATDTVSKVTDGVPEVNIYPDNNSQMPSGNRGTVDLGSPNNSTSDLKRQIVYGLNAYDLSFFPNSRIEFNSQGTLTLNGDTGISAGIEASLQSIIGDIRALPIFTQVSGPGNNANYTIVKFVGVRIMAVKLSGGPTQRYLRVQPAAFMTRNGIRGNVPVTVDTVLSQPVLIQ
jgi:Flp pilus assembly protein TadG